MTNPNDTASMAVAYVQRGWKVIQLHDVTAGACSCQLGQYCESPGKHPLVNAWQLSSLGTAPEVYAAWARNPRANLGIVTGPDSGIWVLDIDPKHDGHLALAALEMEHGALPKTYTARTGSGGMHFYFDLANVDFDLNNSTGGARESSKFPLGMDVRGRGGFVVAAPSISGYGPYGVLPDPDAMAQVSPLMSAPGWVVERQRPKPYIRPEIRPDAIFREGHSYALTAVRGELAMMAGAVPGTRNDVAFKVGCRLYELALADWAGLDFDMVQAAFLDACEQANVDGKFLYGEAWSVWLKAQRKVREPAVLPPATFHGTPMIGWTMPPGTVASDFDQAGESPAYPFSSPGTYQTLTNVAEKSINGPSEQQKLEQYEQYEAERAERRAQYILSQAEKLRADREVRRIVDSEERPSVDWSAEILDEDQLDELSESRPLIQGVLDGDAFFRIVGRSGSKKSFVAIDMAVCVSAGIPWHGHAVQQGPVLYVLGEGAAGIKKRLQGARQHYGLARHGVRIVRRPVQFAGVEWDSFVAHLAGMAEGVRPSLVFLDTQAQLSTGLDENYAKDQSVIVGACRTLRAATGACVVLIHHVGLGDAKRGRGITTIFDALDNEILVTSNDMIIELEFMKTKEDEKPHPLTLKAERVDVGHPRLVKDPTNPFSSPALKQETTLVLVDGEDAARSKPNTRELSQVRQLLLIEVLRDQFGAGGGGSEAAIKAAFMALPEFAKMSAASAKKAFDRAWGALEALGRLARNPRQSKFRFAEFDGMLDLEENADRVAPKGWDGWTTAQTPPQSKRARE